MNMVGVEPEQILRRLDIDLYFDLAIKVIFGGIQR